VSCKEKARRDDPKERKSTDQAVHLDCATWISTVPSAKGTSSSDAEGPSSWRLKECSWNAIGKARNVRMLRRDLSGTGAVA
jgi:hypothetical protein